MAGSYRMNGRAGGYYSTAKKKGGMKGNLSTISFQAEEPFVIKPGRHDQGSVPRE